MFGKGEKAEIGDSPTPPFAALLHPRENRHPGSAASLCIAVHGAAVGVHGVAVGVHGAAVGVLGVTVGVHGAAVGVHGAAVGVLGVTVFGLIGLMIGPSG